VSKATFLFQHKSCFVVLVLSSHTQHWFNDLKLIPKLILRLITFYSKQKHQKEVHFVCECEAVNSFPVTASFREMTRWMQVSEMATQWRWKERWVSEEIHEMHLKNTSRLNFTYNTVHLYTLLLLIDMCVWFNMH